MGKNNRMSHINILIFVSLIFIISILNIFSPKDKAISEVENRTLAQRPAFTWDKLLKGEYFREYEDFFATTFTTGKIWLKLAGISRHLKA